MICITFDTDWMEPAWMDAFLAGWDPPGRATFFQHRAFPALARTRHELCPHPAISSLEEWQDGVERLTRDASPGAAGLRPHSCVFSHALGVGLRQMGFRWISQANNQYESKLRPLRHPWGLWELPIYYMDNMDFWMPRNWPAGNHTAFDTALISRAIDHEESLFVFAFHPLHLALNTRTPEDYEKAKPRILREGVSPLELRSAGRGTAVFYDELREAMAKRNLESLGCSEALRRFCGPDA